MIVKLETLDSELRQYHLELVDLLEDETSFSREQEYLNEYDKDVAKIAVGIEQLLSACSEPASANARKIEAKDLQQNSNAVKFRSPSCVPADRPNTCLLHQYEEQLKGYKRELSDIRRELLSYDVD